ncbi:cation diffusion facilitator family transporter [Hyphomicrobium denitrificans 1NES1]|uniref:Cation diffusion facilitator family transporter n=1 Tax=Hyphomicrobium denitrificans 1NES1 TaxID=670307 RepID=N0B9N5_9HYPH|nr:cation diffusion facilitator family transporter [Hyphomicrobium denitrificans]AGK57251.1 cation diffusion facilitator family transporter [Hyphomicrobium denitrificans 1NES1]
MTENATDKSHSSSHEGQMHDHGHDHSAGSHAHSHAHSHAPKDFGFAFALGAALNVAFIIVEAAAGFYANSMALLADAGHNLSDVLGLLIAWGATLLIKRRPTLQYTYGFGSSTILAALANAVLLLVAVGAIILESGQRLGSSVPPVGGVIVIIVAAIGILINGFTAWLFVSGSERDVNIRGAYLHMAADAAVSFGVVVVGFTMLTTGWNWLDPVVSLVIAAVIIWGTWGLLRDTMRLALHGVPARISTAQVRGRLASLPGVESVHDLHIWPMSTTETALTCHLVMPGGHPGDAFISETAKMLHDEFEIRHTTLQFEVGSDIPCGSECAV